jgi:hypothetical protein
VRAPVERGTGRVPQPRRDSSTLCSWKRRSRYASSSLPAAPGSRPSRRG